VQRLRKPINRANSARSENEARELLTRKSRNDRCRGALYTKAQIPDRLISGGQKTRVAPPCSKHCFAWPFLVEWVTRELRERYQPPEELPLNLLQVLWRLDAKTEAAVHGIRGNFEILT
jgi:hypothetical protein